MIVLTELIGGFGIVIGTAIAIAVMATSKTLSGRNYLYPVFPFDLKAFLRMFIRTKL